MLNKFSRIVGLVLVIYSFVGCNQEKIEKLRAENESLKNQVELLSKENSKLKETADFYYKTAIDYMTSNRYEDAKVEFRKVIERFPASNLVILAKQQIQKVDKELAKLKAQKQKEERLRRETERRRKEEERNKPKTPEESDKEWVEFRNNECSYNDTITTWILKYVYLQEGYNYGEYDKYFFHLNGDYRRGVMIKFLLKDDMQRSWASPIQSLHKDDWLIMMGHFGGVTEDGEVILVPEEVKIIGYMDQ